MAALPTDGIEWFYSIQHENASNRAAYRTDDKQWKAVQKSQTFWRNEIVPLKARIQDAYFPAFMAFLVANKGLDITLSTPGLIPFVRDSVSNTVQLLDWKSVTQVLPKHKELTVYFLNNATTPTT